MSTFLIGIVVALALLVILKGWTSSNGFMRRSYFLGVTLWSGWLPIFATLAFVAIVGSNISGTKAFIFSATNLTGYVSKIELLVLFCAAPLFLTRIGNLVATACAVYSIEKLALGGLTSSNLGILIVVGCSTVVAILGDKMPWLRTMNPYPVTNKLREVLILILSFCSLGIIFASLMDASNFGSWLNRTFRIDTSIEFLVIGHIMLFVGWMTVALGLTRHLTLPILILPTLFALAFISSWPSYVLVLPFAAGLALSLATADRRLLPR